MANYYYVTIESEKMNQNIANEILQEIVKSNYIRHFSFQDGYLHFNSRGLPDIAELLACYDFNDEEDKIKIEDEFERFYKYLSNEEYKELCKNNEKINLENIKEFSF